MAVGEKEQQLKEVVKEREVWRQRDKALAAVLQEKEALILCLKEGLESCQTDVQVGFFCPSLQQTLSGFWMFGCELHERRPCLGSVIP